MAILLIHHFSTHTALDILTSNRYNRNYVLVTPFMEPRPKILVEKRTIGPLGLSRFNRDTKQFKYNVYIAIKFLLRISKWFINADSNLTF